MNRKQLIEAVARGANIRLSDIEPGVSRDVTYDEVIEFIRTAAFAEGAFPRRPGDPEMSEQAFLVRQGEGWSVVWYASPVGGALPPTKYEKRFQTFIEAFEDFVGGYLPRPSRRVRFGAAFIVPF
jgi:hypothetical protein